MIVSRTYFARVDGRLVRVSSHEIDRHALANISQRFAAADAFNRAKRRGEIVPPAACERCGATSRIFGHHHDYAKPLDVAWLCHACHGAEHARLRRETAVRLGYTWTERLQREPGSPHKGCCTVCNQNWHDARGCPQRRAGAA